MPTYASLRAGGGTVTVLRLSRRTRWTAFLRRPEMPPQHAAELVAYLRERVRVGHADRCDPH
jgi:hypothetical protein